MLLLPPALLPQKACLLKHRMPLSMIERCRFKSNARHTRAAARAQRYGKTPCLPLREHAVTRYGVCATPVPPLICAAMATAAARVIYVLFFACICFYVAPMFAVEIGRRHYCRVEGCNCAASALREALAVFDILSRTRGGQRLFCARYARYNAALLFFCTAPATRGCVAAASRHMRVCLRNGAQSGHAHQRNTSAYFSLRMAPAPRRAPRCWRRWHTPRRLKGRRGVVAVKEKEGGRHGGGRGYEAGRI